MNQLLCSRPSLFLRPPWLRYPQSKSWFHPSFSGGSIQPSLRSYSQTKLPFYFLSNLSHFHHRTFLATARKGPLAYHHHQTSHSYSTSSSSSSSSSSSRTSFVHWFLVFTTLTTTGSLGYFFYYITTRPAFSFDSYLQTNSPNASSHSKDTSPVSSSSASHAYLYHSIDPRAPYQGWSLFNLLTSYCVFQLCRLDFFVQHAHVFFHVASYVPGLESLFKKTFMYQFCGGESKDEVHQRLSQLHHQLHVIPILDLAIEHSSTTEEEVKAIQHTEVGVEEEKENSMTSSSSLDKNSSKAMIANQTSFEPIVNGIQQSIDWAAHHRDQFGTSAMVALKCTALISPKLLSDLSKSIQSYLSKTATLDSSSSSLLHSYLHLFPNLNSPSPPSSASFLSKLNPTESWTRFVSYFRTPSQEKKQPILTPTTTTTTTSTSNINTLIHSEYWTPLFQHLYPLSSSTQEQVEFTHFTQQLLHLSQYASQHQVSLMFDAEQVEYQDAIDLVVLWLSALYNPVSSSSVGDDSKQKNKSDEQGTRKKWSFSSFTNGNAFLPTKGNTQEQGQEKEEKKEQPRFIYQTYQMYLKNGLDKLKLHYEVSQRYGFQLAVKLVRGAYLTYERDRANQLNLPSPVHDDIESTHASYLNAMQFLHHHTIPTMLATHNVESIVTSFSLPFSSSSSSTSPTLPQNKPSVPSSMKNWTPSYAQLLGMQDITAIALHAFDKPCYKYVPYGPWHLVGPYLVRRAQENHSVMSGASLERELLWNELVCRWQELIGVRPKLVKSE